MICSCFNPKSGQYDYFETKTTYPFNSDLPVPQLPSTAGRVGVPAIEAGRPLPRDAKPVGSGWSARGVLVRCGSPLGQLSSFEDFAEHPVTQTVSDGVWSVLAGYGTYALYSSKSPKSSESVRAISGIATAGLVFWYMKHIRAKKG